MIGIILLVIILSLAHPSPGFSTFSTTPIVKKVMVVDLNPSVSSQGGQRIREIKHWNDPKTLETTFIENIRQASGGYLNYQIVQRIDNEDWLPPFKDGYQHTGDTLLQAINNPSARHLPDKMNYNVLLNRYQICDKVNSGEVDEVWFWLLPWTGAYEAIMTGNGAFDTNGPPLSSSCIRKTHLMAFNCERSVSEMTESYIHRIEGTLTHVFDEDPCHNSSMNTDWGKFGTYDKRNPNKAGCGWSHYPPNGTSDYDWDNTNHVTTNCNDWLNYPNITGSTQSLNCQEWGCHSTGFYAWWLNRLPKSNGSTKNKSNNWWQYIADYDCVTKNICPTSAPVPTSTPNCVKNHSNAVTDKTQCCTGDAELVPYAGLICCGGINDVVDNNTECCSNLTTQPNQEKFKCIFTGDANGDGKANLLDFGTWKTEYLTKTGLNSDFDKNNKVNIADFAVWKAEYLKTK